jgi:hypothetical protein
MTNETRVQAMRKTVKTLQALNEYFSCEGCEACPFQNKCQGYDKGGCYVQNAYDNLKMIVSAPQNQLDPIMQNLDDYEIDME